MNRETKRIQELVREVKNLEKEMNVSKVALESRLQKSRLKNLRSYGSDEK